MGKCIYCGNNAGFLRSKHKECLDTFNRGRGAILTLITNCLKNPSLINTINEQSKKIAIAHNMTDDNFPPVVFEGWDTAVKMAFEDGLLSEDEEKCLKDIAYAFGIGQNELDKNGSWTKLLKGKILRNIMQGKTPNSPNFNVQIPFSFQKGESLIWLFQNVRYYEMKTHRTYSGGSSGVSFKIAKGVYLRSGAFKGQPVIHNETVQIGTGTMGITDKHVYFACNSKSFRIKHDSIVSITPYSNGVSIQKDGANAKPQSFITSDPWFTYNLLTNVKLIS